LWQQIQLKPVLDRIRSRLIDLIWVKRILPEWNQEQHQFLAHQSIHHVLATFFRALPLETTLRIAIREALRRLPCEGGLKGIPIFEGDSQDAYGGALMFDPSPIVSEADFVSMKTEAIASAAIQHQRAAEAAV
jgi:hypothetical protein